MVFAGGGRGQGVGILLGGVPQLFGFSQRTFSDIGGDRFRLGAPRRQHGFGLGEKVVRLGLRRGHDRLRVYLCLGRYLGRRAVGTAQDAGGLFAHRRHQGRLVHLGVCGALFGLAPGRIRALTTLSQGAHLLGHLGEELLDLLGVITPPTLREATPLDHVCRHLGDITMAGAGTVSWHDLIA